MSRGRPGVKAQVAALLQGGREGTLEQLLPATGGKEVSLKAALSDLKSDKYAGATGKLNIVRTETAPTHWQRCYHKLIGRWIRHSRIRQRFQKLVRHFAHCWWMGASRWCEPSRTTA